MKLKFAVFLLCLFTALQFPASVHAAEFTANDPVSLIIAINTANSNNQDDVIRLTGNIFFLATDNITDGNNATPSILPDGGHTLTIEGNGLSVNRNAGSYRYFHVTAGGNLTLRNLDLMAGAENEGAGVFNRGILRLERVWISQSTGSGLRNFGAATILHSTIYSNMNLGGDGGGIENSGTMTITNSRIWANQAARGGGIWNEAMLTIRDSGIYSNSGGGIYSSSLTSISNSTISHNELGIGNGAGLYNAVGAVTNITNGTIANNRAFSGSGGGFYNEASLFVYNGTVVNNQASAVGGGFTESGLGIATFNNSIIAGNTAPADANCSGGLLAGGTNLANGGGCPGTFGAISPGTDYDTTLGNYGGPTDTIRLLAGSVALDASGAGATSSDQRGAAANGVRDVGAFELTTISYPTIGFALSNDSYLEATNTVDVGLSITGASNFVGTAYVFIEKGFPFTASAGLDFADFYSQTITIDCTTGTCSAVTPPQLSILADALSEADETVLMEIVEVSGSAVMGAALFEATIRDTGTVTITANDPDATENPVDNGQFTLDLGFVNTTGSVITVDFTVTGTATNGTDYSVIALSADIPIGAQTALIDISPIDDPDLEGSETVILTLTGTNNLSIGVDGTPATVTIVDDEAPTSPTAVPSSPSTTGPQPQIGVFDPAISKLGLLFPGQTGIVGEELEWVVTVSNTGTVVGTNVTVTDTLIPALRVDSVDAPGATVTISGQTVTVVYPSLNVSQTVQFSIFTTVLQGASINNTACVNASNQGAQECVTTLPVSQLPNTGESPWWRYMLLAGLGLIGTIGLGLTVKSRKLKIR